MTRVPENSLKVSLLNDVAAIRNNVAKFSNQVSSGYKVRTPGESDQGGVIGEYRQTLDRVKGYKDRIGSARSMMQFQDDALAQINELMTRARELAEQGLNETNGVSGRQQTSEEIFKIRDSLVGLVNSKYQGVYIFGGTDTDDPPIDQQANYTEPATGSGALRYDFDTEVGMTSSRTAQITDNISVTLNVTGANVFDGALYALERMGRAMAGYQTTLTGNQPTGAGAAYTFPTDFSQQTQDIGASLDSLITAIDQNIMPTRVQLGSRLNILDTATSVIDVQSANFTEALNKLQATDQVEAISNLTTYQNALDAALSVTSRIINFSILQFL